MTIMNHQFITCNIVGILVIRFGIVKHCLRKIPKLLHFANFDECSFSLDFSGVCSEWVLGFYVPPTAKVIIRLDLF